MTRSSLKQISGTLHSISVEWGEDPQALNCKIFPPGHEHAARRFYHETASKWPIHNWFYRVKTNPKATMAKPKEIP